MIDEPIYETHSMTSHNQVQVQEPEPAAKRRRPGRIERLKRQRDELARQNAAMRKALGQVTQIMLDTVREVRF